VADPKYFRNYRLFAFHKMTDPEEDSPEVEDSLEAADSPEVEDSLEEADTQVEAEYRLEDHQEAGGDHHRFLCHKPNKENW